MDTETLLVYLEENPQDFDEDFHYEVYEHIIVGEPPSIMNKSLLSQ